MSVTLNNIVEELYLSKEFNNCIKKMRPIELQDDLKAEVSLILLEHGERLINIHASGGLNFYATRIILNLIQSKTSPFYKKYRRPMIEINDNISLKENDADEYDNRLLLELKEEKVMQIIEGLYWYDKELLKLYVQLGTYREIEKVTKIPWRSVYDSIQSAIAKIKYELRTSK